MTGGLSSGRSSSAGSKERVAHDEISAQDDPVVRTPSQEEADGSAPLEPVNVDVSSTPNDNREGEKGAQEAEEVDPATIPLPASPAIGDTSSSEPAFSLEPAASLPPPLPIFDGSSISVEPLDRTISEESEGVPSLVDTDKAGEDRGEEGTEVAVEGEQLVTPINSSETTGGVVRVLSTDRIEEEDEDEAEREEEKEDTSTADIKPLGLSPVAQEPANAGPIQERSVVDTTSRTLGGDAGSPNSTSSPRGNTSVSPSEIGRERSPVHGSAGQYGQPQQQHQQFRQQCQRQPYHQQQQQQQQRPQQYQPQQQHQQYSTSTSSGSQSLGRSGSRQIRQSVYGLNKVS